KRVAGECSQQGLPNRFLRSQVRRGDQVAATLFADRAFSGHVAQDGPGLPGCSFRNIEVRLQVQTILPWFGLVKRRGHPYHRCPTETHCTRSCQDSQMASWQMRNFSALCLTSLLALALVTNATRAQESATPQAGPETSSSAARRLPESLFQQLDKNRDGVIDDAELTAAE